MDTNDNNKNNKVKKPRAKKIAPVAAEVVVPSPEVVEEVKEVKEKKPVKRVRKTKEKEVVKVIEHLSDTEQAGNQDSDGDDDKQVEDKESNIVTDKEIQEEKEQYGYLIIQEFPHIDTTYVIGSKPFGKIWYNYTEALEQFITILIDWQVDFDNKEIIHSKKPRIVKIRVF